MAHLLALLGKPETTEIPSNLFFAWLVRLRWGTVACQGLLILVVQQAFDLDVPLPLVLSILAFEGVSNLLFHYLRKRKVAIPEQLFGLIMHLDVILLTVLLYLTGGPMNPFTFLYLVHIVLGAILMSARWAWGLTIFTILCYASFFFPAGGLFRVESLNALSSRGQDPFLASVGLLSMHLQGMWVAFSITACFIVFFVGRIQQALAIHQQTLISLNDERLRGEKLAALATLAAGAAHEFATPLSTIAVAAGEMQRLLKQEGGASQLLDDARLVRQQVERCKEILCQMSADAGEHLGEATEDVSVRDLLNESVALFLEETGKSVLKTDEVEDLRITIPPRTVKRTIKGLLKNGLDAAGREAPLALQSRRDQSFLYIVVTDQGPGMDQETLARACEPFFTRKPPDRGLGLGLYLARAVALRYGGDLLLDSEPGRGTKATMSLSLAHLQAST